MLLLSLLTSVVALFVLTNEWAQPLPLLQPACACCQGSLFERIKTRIQVLSEGLSMTQHVLYNFLRAAQKDSLTKMMQVASHGRTKTEENMESCVYAFPILSVACHCGC
uniref:Putative secreted protein n=1 Tax=Amblyomma cajennense TaxID=34607 RepID=A0A023FCG1_AMBCJ